jgi:hypothetical protein
MFNPIQIFVRSESQTSKLKHLGPGLDCLKGGKMLQGEGVLYEEENLNQVFGQKADQFNFDKFKYMCIMSGIRQSLSLKLNRKQRECLPLHEIESNAKTIPRENLTNNK